MKGQARSYHGEIVIDISVVDIVFIDKEIHFVILKEVVQTLHADADVFRQLHIQTGADHEPNLAFVIVIAVGFEHYAAGSAGSAIATIATIAAVDSAAIAAIATIATTAPLAVPN